MLYQIVEWTAEFDDIENNNIKGSLFYPEFNGDEAASGKPSFEL